MLQLSNPSRADLSSNPQAESTISDDDTPPVLVSISGGDTVEEGGSLDFTVSLNATPTTDVSVRFRVDSPYYSHHPLWVQSGLFCGHFPNTDYVDPSSNLLEWAAGNNSLKTVSIQTCDDSLDEADTKTFDVELHTPSGALIGTGSASGTITDNDAPSTLPPVANPTFFIDSPTVTEGDELEFTATFMPIGASWRGTLTITLSGSATLAAASDVCGGAGVDAHIDRNYTSSQDTYSRTKYGQGGWQGGETARLKVRTCDDTTPEALETLTATLSTTPRSGGTNADVGPAGTGTIIDNDTPVVYLDGDVTEPEGGALNFTVRLREASPEDVIVTVSTGADPAAIHSAEATSTPRDYLPKTSYQVTIPAGLLTETVSVFTVSDIADEYDETFLLRIDDADSAIGANVGSPAEAVGTITDNDNPPTVSISDASADESNAIPFDVSLATASRKTVTVTASTAPATASETNACSADDGTEDYQTRTRPLTFPPGVTTQTFNVTICEDTADEPDETFTITLTTPSNATLGTASTTGTIIDNDSSVQPPLLK